MDLDDTAGLIFCLEYHDEHKTMAEGWRRWKRMLASLNEGAWANGGHFGDCTKQAITCQRCMIEDLRAQAQMLIDDSQPRRGTSERIGKFEIIDNMLEHLEPKCLWENITDIYPCGGRVLAREDPDDTDNDGPMPLCKEHEGCGYP